VMAAIVLQDDATLSPEELEQFLGDQADLSAKAWPRYVRIASDLPSTATNKVLKRELAAEGASAGTGVLWTRDARGTSYAVSGGVPV
jgi:fatty-acyl-CoA synthase